MKFFRTDAEFQSTLLQEERHVECIFHDRIIYFNPRSYKRSDAMNAELIKTSGISIHAPTRGATPAMVRNTVRLSIFQSTLLQEERPRTM